LEVKNRILEEAKVSFPVAPRTRNGNEVGGKFLFKNLKLFVSGFACNAGEGPVWHLSPDGLGRDSV
jgi:hypothetical protein